METGASSATKGCGAAFGGVLGCFAGVCVIGVGLLFILFKGCEGIRPLPTDPQSTAREIKLTPRPQTQDSSRVTMAKYESLKTGMSYEDAKAILGSDGQEMSRNEIGNITTVMYSWSNFEGTNMNAIFQNGKLASKSQFGLK